MIAGFVKGPVKLQSILDIVRGNKPISDLYKPLNRENVIIRGIQVALDDNNVYMSVTRYSDNIDTLLSIFLINVTQAEIDSIKLNLPPLTQDRQAYWDSHSHKSKTVQEVSLKKNRKGIITGGFLYDISTRTLAYFLRNMPKMEIEAILKARNIYTKSSNRIIQSESVMFEFLSTGQLVKIFRR
ncbi:MAG: hypothetical protein MJK12_16035 [Colwellia sp.]|nr:hypothetical protein [Colwellia sp.]